MKSMKMSKSQKESSYPTAGEAPETPEYPYGLCLRLDKETMIKLGFEGLPKVGDSCVIEAKATVQSVSMGAGQGGEYASCELQITDMGLDSDAEDKKSKAAKQLFGSMK